MNRLIALLALLLLAAASRAVAQGSDDQYVRIYSLIQEADTLNSGGQPRQALDKFIEAQTALQRFQKTYPTWNPNVVTYRLNYLATKISTVSAKVPGTANSAPAPANGQPGATPPTGPATSAETDAQMNQLREQVRQLQGDKGSLESKLREALAAQPGALDTRQLNRAQDRIRSLEKENDLLKVTLGQAKSTTGAGDARALQQAQRALAETNQRLSEQTEKANLLSLERTALQQKVNGLMAAGGAGAGASANALEATRRQLDQTTKQLNEQKDLNAKLVQERDTLQARIKNPAAAAPLTGAADSELIALRAENQMLKKQAAEAAINKGGDTGRQLSQAQARIAALQSDKDLLRLEKAALENRLKQASAGGAQPVMTSTALPGSGKASDSDRVKQLEADRDRLQKQLVAANKELSGRNSKLSATRVQELEGQIASLRARLEVFEARRVPYSQEELVLFQRQSVTLAAPNSRAGKKSIKELPSGSATLVAEAQRFYATRQYDKAEQNYLKILSQDPRNVPTLANLAAIQIELKRYDEAEKNIKTAISIAPDDAYSQLVLGQLRLKQGKWDEAVEALSAAAKLEPENATIQNFLGLALNEKGLRGPAETALRRAVQLDPSNGSAHYSLAVVYATQQPAHVELARWHYQKALGLGVVRNPDLEKLFEARANPQSVQ